MAGEIIEVDLANKRLCFFCGKRIATKLCDAPLAVIKWCGHPPRYMTQNRPWEYPREVVATCDRFLCDKCAVDMGRGLDFCPLCVKRLKYG